MPCLYMIERRLQSPTLQFQNAGGKHPIQKLLHCLIHHLFAGKDSYYSSKYHTLKTVSLL